jgi:succinate dehydrogenase/fumarate reductase flavoprotein subunit
MNDYQTLQTDVLVIGGGGAGCQAAMAAADAGAEVTLLEKGRVGLTGNTFDPFTWGKGIIVAIQGYNPTDDPEVHVREAMAAARGLANPALVRAVAYEAPARFRELLAMGLGFIPNQLGTCFGESMVGATIDQPSLGHTFRNQVTARGVRLLEHTMAVNLLGDGRRCCGAVAITRRGEIVVCRAKAVVLATGGASPMFRYNMNTTATTGDGHVMALRAGAELTNLEFYQAILGTTAPAHVYFPQWFLAGKPPLINVHGQRFLADYLPAGMAPEELVFERSFHGPFSYGQPSGWVDIAIEAEIQAGRGTVAWEDEKHLAGVYCDFASLPADLRQQLDGREAMPALAWLKARGLDFEAQPVPVAPFAHAFNGGIVINEHGATRVPGLFACGEVAAGPHGANRLGGHMFAVLLVFGTRAGRRAAEEACGLPLPVPHEVPLQAEIGRLHWLRARDQGTRPQDVRRAVQRAMSRVMIAKDADRLRATLTALRQIRAGQLADVLAPSPHDLFEAVGAANLLEMASLVATAALLRDESRGPHYRTDHPQEGASEFERNLLCRLDGETVTYQWGHI